MKISAFEIENVKRVRAVACEPSENGLTIIGGNNNNGKTSVLDAIAWALGGNKYMPDAAQNEDSVLPPHIRVVLSNGIVVERKGKNSDLTVTDPTGARAGQALLNSFVEQLALDLPKFMNASDKEKAEVLLKIIGVGDQLKKLDNEYSSVYNQRHAYGQLVTQKQKYAAELPSYPDAPDHLISSMELIQRNSEILARNGENKMKRDDLQRLEQEQKLALNEYLLLQKEMEDLSKKIREKESALNAYNKHIEIARKTVEELQDESTDEIQAQLHDIDNINTKVRANMQKITAQEEANQMSAQYDHYSATLDDIRKQRTDLLKNADLPLPGLNVEDGLLTYNGKKWGDMSGSEQLIVAASIVRKLNPECQFVLMDKLEQLDLNTLNAFNQWLMSQNMQVIATRVSTGNECQIIIEDGMIKPKETSYAMPTKDWRNA